MKTTFLAIFIGLCVCANGISQNALSDLKKFYETADMKYYIGKIQKNIKECHKAQCKKWKVDESVNAPKIDLSKQKTIPMLAIQFVNMEKYDFDEDIYNHITIDSARVFTLACVNEKTEVFAFANYYDGTYAYEDISMERPDDAEKLKHIINNIDKQQPELLLFCHSLKRARDLNSFMYIKKDKIYVYHLKENAVYELNDYVRQFFSETDLRNLGYTAVTFIQQFYEKKPSRERTGDTPSNRNMISLR